MERPEGITNSEVICPYCGEEQDISEARRLVTYWGEDGPQQRDCDHCGLSFMVEEHVSRSFTSRPMVQKKAKEKAQ